MPLILYSRSDDPYGINLNLVQASADRAILGEVWPSNIGIATGFHDRFPDC
jgi:hypothetical protein